MNNRSANLIAYRCLAEVKVREKVSQQLLSAVWKLQVTSGSLIAGLAPNNLTATNFYLGLTGLDVDRSIIIIADLLRDDLAQ